MIRQTILTVLIAILCVYSFRDWYKSLCGLIVFTAIFQHPDIKGSILGIPGLNPWNILFACVFMGWLSSRGHEKLKWDMPRPVVILLMLYLLIIVIGFVRMISDVYGIYNYELVTQGQISSANILWSEYLINTLKWALPGFLLYDGCRTEARFKMAVFSILAIYFLLSVQVIKWMPLSSFGSGGELSYRSSKILQNEVGYSRVNLSAILAGGTWAIFSATLLLKDQKKYLLIMAGITVMFAQALTGGRAGYMAFIFLSIVMCILKFRKQAFLIIASLIIIILIIPGVLDRISLGMFDPEPSSYYSKSSEQDLYTITSGRNIAWPYEIEKIEESPWIGYGRMSMQRTGISEYLWVQFEESFPHPHNAYLEWILDNGIIGFIPIIIFYFILLKCSLSLFFDNRSSIFIAIGGVCFALIFSLMIASFGSQTFYPREGSVGMWCSIGLMLRVYVERARAMNGIESETREIGSLIWKK